MARLTAALALLLVLCPAAWAQMNALTPTDAIRETFSRADAVLADRATSDRPLERLAAIRKLVSEAFDARSAAELASGEHWETRTPAEQEEFSRLLGELLERSFVSRMATTVNLERGLHLDYLGELVNGATARVHTAMNRRGGGQMLLDYRMIDRDGTWKIRDVAIDGVSVMANYRAQLDRVLVNGSFSDLLAQMRARAGAPEPPATIASAPAPEKPVVATVALIAHATPDPQPPEPPVTIAAVEPPVVEPPAPVRPPEPPVAVAPPEPPQRPAATPSEAPFVNGRTTRAYWLRMSKVESAEEAGHLMSRLGNSQLTVTLERASAGGALRVDVRVGPFRDAEEAVLKLLDLQTQGHESYLVAERE